MEAVKLRENLFGTDLVETAVERLRVYEPPEGYYVAFSGGKDSVVVLDLCQRAGVKFDPHYSLTTVDPPELVHFIRREHPEVGVHRPPEPLLQKLVVRGFPTRFSRWCCEYLKEKSSVGRFTVTGVRRAESSRRRGRQVVEVCRRRGDRLLHPIIEWTDRDVWEYIRENGLPYCGLYDEGWKRLGCVLCPLTSAELAAREAVRWPKIAGAWQRAFNRLYRYRKSQGLPSVDRWSSGDEMFRWWMARGQDLGRVEVEGQGALFDN